MPIKTVLPALLAGALLFAATAHAEDHGDKEIYGWVEKAELQPSGTEVKAKLDSGALTSSLQAEDIERFEKNDEKWVRFTTEVVAEDQDEEVSLEYEKPLFRDVTIRGAGGKERRPVVLVTMCIGDTYYEEQVSLEDREGFNYPLLLGRRTIQHLGTLNVTQTFAHKPGCDKESKTSREAERKDDQDIGI